MSHEDWVGPDWPQGQRCHNLSVELGFGGAFSSCKGRWPKKPVSPSEDIGTFVSWAVLNPAHDALMYVTPEQYEDDVNAFLYYGSMGLLDPKNPTIDAPATARATGWSYGKALRFTLLGGFVGWGAIGWLIDPHDKREGGWAEQEWYREHGPSSWVPRWKRNWERMVG